MLPKNSAVRGHLAPATCSPRSCSSLIWINAAVGDLRGANVLRTGADLGFPQAGETAT
jgi:hypothetical protein